MAEFREIHTSLEEFPVGLVLVRGSYLQTVYSDHLGCSSGKMGPFPPGDVEDIAAVYRETLGQGFRCHLEHCLGGKKIVDVIL